MRLYGRIWRSASLQVIATADYAEVIDLATGVRLAYMMTEELTAAIVDRGPAAVVELAARDWRRVTGMPWLHSTAQPADSPAS